MKKSNRLEALILALEIGETLTVKNFKERARAQQIALRNGIKIKTQARLVGLGYEVLREA